MEGRVFFKLQFLLILLKHPSKDIYIYMLASIYWLLCSSYKAEYLA